MGKRKRGQEVQKKPSKLAPEIIQSDNEDQFISDDDVDLIQASSAFVDDGMEDEEDEDSEDDGSIASEEEEVETIDIEQNVIESKIVSTKSNENSLYSLPTNAEMQELKGTADLYKSNLFKLQIDELLSQVRIDYTKFSKVEKTLHKIKELVDVHREILGIDLPTAKKQMKKKYNIEIPFPHPLPKEDTPYKFVYKKPSATHLVGSFPLQTIAKNREKFGIDMVFVIPKSVFQEKDNLNYRFFHKRAFYLANIAAAIRSLPVDFEYTYLNGDFLRPCLLVKSRNDSNDYDFSKSKCFIRIMTMLEPDTFPIQKLAPARNNVRHLDGEKVPAEELIPTPQYNNSILYEIAHVAHLSFLYKHLKACEGFKDACLLGNVWLKQHNFSSDEGHGGVGPFFFAMIIAFLLEHGGSNGRKRLGNGYSSYQLFKGTMDFLATYNFRKTIFMGEAPHSDFNSDAFETAFDLAVIGPTGTVNLASAISNACINRIQDQARICMLYLNDNTIDRFGSIFLRRVADPMKVYDHILRFEVPNGFKILNGEHVPTARAYRGHIERILTKALTNRIKLLTTWVNESYTWKLSDKTPNLENAIVNVGLLIVPTKSGRLVDHGPLSSSPEVEDFRQFWGEKAETRRFSDGSIRESVVWEVKNPDERTGIIERIVRYISKLHLNDPVIHVWGRQLSSLIRLPKVSQEIFGEVASLSAFPSLSSAFDELVKKLRSYEDLPLQISNIAAVDSLARFTSILPPVPVDVSAYMSRPSCARHIHTVRCIITFEKSGKWPDNLIAIQKTKLAFLLAIREKLECESGIMNSAVGLEYDTGEEFLDSGYLEVVDEHGYAFKLVVYHDREMILLEDKEKSLSHSKFQQERLRELIREKRIDMEYLPIHSTTIHTLASKRFPVAYQATTRLIKRWLRSHMISGLDLPDDIIELICASIYVNPEPYGCAPVNGTTGFIRVLEMLSIWDWVNEPLIIDFGMEEISYDDGSMIELNGIKRQQIVEEFERLRKEDPSLSKGSYYVVSNLQGSIVDRKRPTRMIAGRVSQLAKAAVKVLDQVSRDNVWEDISTMNSIGMQLFTPALEDYDFVLRLDIRAISRYYENIRAEKKYLQVKSAYKNLPMQGGTSGGNFDLLIDHDPIREFVKDIIRVYGDSVAIFYDECGGDVICGVFNPGLIADQGRSWRVNLGFNSISSKPDDEDVSKGKKLVTLNKDAIVEELRRIGVGILA